MREERTDEAHRAYLATSHAKTRQIKKETNLSWRALIEEITQDPKKIWKMARRARQGAGKLPPIS